MNATPVGRLASFIGTTLVTMLTCVAQTLVWNRVRTDSGWTPAVCAFALVPLATLIVGVLRTIVFGRSVSHRGQPRS